MALPNYHSVSLQDKTKFDSETFALKPGGKIYGRVEIPDDVSVLWGKIKGQNAASTLPIPVSLRFNKEKWDNDKIKKWLIDNKVKYLNIEEAKETMEDDNVVTIKIADLTSEYKEEIVEAEEFEEFTDSEIDAFIMASYENYEDDFEDNDPDQMVEVEFDVEEE